MTKDEVDQLRDAGMAQVQEKAERLVPAFTDAACAYVLAHLRKFGPCAGEVLTEKCKDAGLVPHDDRAFGPVYMRLLKRGLIEKIGSIRRERGHGTAGGNIWRATT